MTEEKWLTCRDPVWMLAHLDRPVGDRKLFLYAAACCRAHWHLLSSAPSREAVEWAERFADGEVPRDQKSALLRWLSEGAAMDAERQAARKPVEERMYRGVVQPWSLEVLATYFAHGLVVHDPTSPLDPTLSRYERLLSVPVLRDVFGNPFRPVTCSPSWRTDTAVTLARQMYESREFGAMPILADALQDAGCDEPAILDHCRQPGEHVRGCWVVDLVLGKG
jgi:hypothetical protein